MKILKSLLLAYVLVIPFNNLIELPLFERRLQLTELVFGFLFCFTLSIKDIRIRLLSRSILMHLNLWLLTLVIALIISVMCSFSINALMELAGIGYLVLLYVVVRLLMDVKIVSLGELEKAFLCSGILIALTAILGWLLSYNSIVNNLCTENTTYYPYIGNVGRASGFTSSPSMLCIYLGCCLFIIVNKFMLSKESRWPHVGIFLLLLFGSIITFSKSLILIFAGILYLFFCPSNKAVYQIGRRIILILSIGIYIVLTHFVFIPNSIPKSAASKYVASEPIFRQGTQSVFYTNYYLVKRSLFLSAKENPLFGIGLGEHRNYMRQKRSEGLCPQHLPIIDPHSTYLGILSEAGFFGFITLLVFLFHLVYNVWSYRIFRVVYFKPILYLLLVDAINTDILNFRFLWVFIAILMFINSRQN